MPEGMETYNTHGTKVADAISPTLGLRSKQTVTVPAGAGRTRVVEIEIPSTETPAFAFRSLGAGRAFAAQYAPKAGTPTTAVIRVFSLTEAYVEEGSSWQTEAINTTALQVVVYHFDRPDNSGNFGLQLFDAAGKCTYNSNNKPARVLKVVSNDDTTTYAGVTDVAVIPFMYSEREVLFHAVDGWIETATRETFRQTANQVIFNQRMMNNVLLVGSGPADLKVAGTPGAMMINVTGF